MKIKTNIAFMPLHAVSKGPHVLVAPKLQVDQIVDLPEEDYQSLMLAVKKVGRRMMEVLHPTRVGIQVIGLDVPHSEKVTVTYHPALAAPQQMIERIERAGYHVPVATLELPITGMTCANCVATVERSTKKVAGVSEAVVNFGSEKVTVTYDPALATPQQMIERIERAGYRVPVPTMELPITGMNFRLDINETELGRGVSDQAVTVPAWARLWWK